MGLRIVNAIICMKKEQDALENAGSVADFQGCLEMLPAGCFFLQLRHQDQSNFDLMHVL